MAHAEIYSQFEDLLALRFHVKHRRLNHQQKLISEKGGYHQAVRKGRGMEFNEVREYVAGDDIRHIDWKVSARTQKVHTKVFTEELERPVLCLVEQTPKLFFGSKVRFKAAQALNVVSVLGWITVHQGDRFGGLVFNQQHHWVEPKHQQQSIVRLFQYALKQQQQLQSPGAQQTDWFGLLSQIQHHLKPGQRLFLVGDFLDCDELFFEKLSQLKKHCDLTLIHIYDPLEKQLPAKGLLRLTNGHSVFDIDSSQFRQNKNYQACYREAWDKIWQFSHSLHIPLVEISTWDDPVEALLQQKVIR